MKFSATQEVRWPLIHRSSRRVSACEMNRSASATVGAGVAALGVGEAFSFEAPVCPFATGAIAAIAAKNNPNIRTRDAFDVTGVKAIRITLSLYSKSWTNTSFET